MKRLTLLRHAKSSWDEPVSRDFDRPLNGKGKRAAERIGKWMADEEFEFSAVVASPATRVIETLEHLEKGIGRKLDPSFNEKIYLASAATLLDIVQQLGDRGDHVLMAGHNPGFEDLVLELIRDDECHILDSVAEKFPTGAVVELEFDCNEWAEAGPDNARLIRFTRPRDLDADLGPDRN